MAEGLHGLILFGHGARHARWVEPFARIAEKLGAAYGSAGPVSLAFLEYMEPDLPAAVHAQVTAGCRAITIIPLFLGQGSHVTRDLAAQVACCVEAYPEVRIHCAKTVGEDDAVLEAIVQYCLASATG